MVLLNERRHNTQGQGNNLQKGLVLAIHLCKYISPDLERFWKLKSGMNLECGERASFMIASIL